MDGAYGIYGSEVSLVLRVVEFRRVCCDLVSK
jgi:hypothetical protein